MGLSKAQKEHSAKVKAENERRIAESIVESLVPPDGLKHVLMLSSQEFYTGAKAQEALERAMVAIQLSGREIVDIKPISHSDKGLTGAAERTTFMIVYV